MDLGLDRSWASLGWSERMVVDKGLSWSARDGLCCSPATAEGGGGALLDAAHEMGHLFLAVRRSGEAKWSGQRRRWWLWEERYGERGGAERLVAIEMASPPTLSQFYKLYGVLE